MIHSVDGWRNGKESTASALRAPVALARRYERTRTLRDRTLAFGLEMRTTITFFHDIKCDSSYYP